MVKDPFAFPGDGARGNWIRAETPSIFGADTLDAMEALEAASPVATKAGRPVSHRDPRLPVGPPLNEEQAAALDILVRNLCAGQDVVLSGPPGVGKTTLLLSLLDTLGRNNVYCCAYTWKAILRLNDVAAPIYWGTFHSVTYAGSQSVAETVTMAHQAAMAKVVVRWDLSNLDVEDGIKLYKDRLPKLPGRRDPTELVGGVPALPLWVPHLLRPENAQRARIDLPVDERILWSAVEVCEAELTAFQRASEKGLNFSRLRTWDKNTMPRFLVIDEVSMINKEDLANLRQAILPAETVICAFGDEHQIPPIEGALGFQLHEPTARLKQVMRQKAGALLDFIRAIVDQRACFPRDNRLCSILDSGGPHDVSLVQLGEYVAAAVRSNKDIITLTVTHARRAAVNNAIRGALGFPHLSLGPVVGERVVFRTSGQQGFNGEIGIVRGVGLPVQHPETLSLGNDWKIWPVVVGVQRRGGEVLVAGGLLRCVWFPTGDVEAMKTQGKLDRGQRLLVTALIRQEEQKKKNEALDLQINDVLSNDNRTLEETLEAVTQAVGAYPLTWGLPNGAGLGLAPGYAVTPWVAQGSQWDNVIVVIDRASWMKDDEYKLWNTAVSRAKDFVLMVQVK